MDALTQAAAIKELERTLYYYSLAWEGKTEEVIKFGDAIVRAEGGGGLVLDLKIRPTDWGKGLMNLLKRLKPRWASVCGLLALTLNLIT